MESGYLDAAPIFADVGDFPWGRFSRIMAGGILSFGWPCQPVSTAGKRKGTEDERWLFEIIADGIGLMRPGILFAENVEGLLSARMPDGSSVFGHCIERLERLHYRVAAGLFSASEVGAPHQRKRVFILAVSSGLGGASGLSGPFQRHEGEPGESDHGGGEAAWPSRPGEQQYGWEPPRIVPSEPALVRDPDGSSGRLDYAELCVTCDNRTDELRLLGNGVVPQTAELAFRELIKELL